jgi:Tol biopolymer transport system component
LTLSSRFTLAAVLVALVLLPTAIATGSKGRVKLIRHPASAGRLVLVSRDTGSAGKPSTAAEAGGISAGGRFAAFLGEGSRIFLRDVRAGRTRPIGEGSGPVLSANARFLAYDSDGKVLVSDIKTGASSLVSRPLPHLLSDVTGSGLSSSPSISADGRYVAFESSSLGLVDENGDRRPDHDFPPYQLYLRDLNTRTTTLISRGSGADGPIGDAESKSPAISANSRYVAFSSQAGNLLPGAPRGSSSVYVRDLATGELRRVSYWHSKPGPHRGDASLPSISANGRYVAFVFVRFGAPASVVVRDLRTGATVNASLLTPHPLELASGAPAISASGRFVAFRAGPTKAGLVRLYLVDLRTRRTQFVHSVSTGEGGALSFSADGRFLLFDTFIDANVPKGTEPLIPAHGDVYRCPNPFAGDLPRRHGRRSI